MRLFRPIRNVHQNRLDQASNAFEFEVERLESRQMLAGTVNVSARGGTMIVRGDGAANSVTISGTNVTGENSTNVVIDDSFVNVGFIRALDIDMGGGNDNVAVEFFSGFGVGDLDVEMGSGNDVFSVRVSDFRNVTIDDAAGNSNITVNNVQVGEAAGKLNIDVASGQHDIAVFSTGPGGASIHGSVDISYGLGSDVDVEVRDVRVRNGDIRVSGFSNQSNIDISNVDRVRNVKIDDGNSQSTGNHFVTISDAKIENGSIIVKQRGNGFVTVSNTTTKRDIQALFASSGSVVNETFGRNLAITGDTTVGKNVKFTSKGDASTSLTLANANVRGSVTATGATRSSSLQMANVTVDRTFRYSGGAGSDDIDIRFSEVKGATTLATSRGNSDTTVLISAFRSLKIDNSGKASGSILDDLFGVDDIGIEQEFDEVDLGGVTLAGNLDVIHGSGGSGTLLQTIVTPASVRVRANQGEDVVSIDGLKARSLDIRTGTTNRREITTVGGSDDDIVAIESDAASFGTTEITNLSIRTYGGSDVVQLSRNSGPGQMTVVRATLDGGFTNSLGVPGATHNDVISIGSLANIGRKSQSNFETE